MVDKFVKKLIRNSIIIGILAFLLPVLGGLFQGNSLSEIIVSSIFSFVIIFALFVMGLTYTIYYVTKKIKRLDKFTSTKIFYFLTFPSILLLASNLASLLLIRFNISLIISYLGSILISFFLFLLGFLLTFAYLKIKNKFRK